MPVDAIFTDPRLASVYDGIRLLGDWDGSGHTDSSPEIIVIARSAD